MNRPKVGVKMRARPVGKKGKFALDINCTKCGLPISKTSDFGMDCANDCARKEFEASGGKKQVAALEKLIRLFSKP
jgi:hypothetical protein